MTCRSRGGRRRRTAAQSTWPRCEACWSQADARYYTVCVCVGGVGTDGRTREGEVGKRGRRMANDFHFLNPPVLERRHQTFPPRFGSADRIAAEKGITNHTCNP